MVKWLVVSVALIAAAFAAFYALLYHPQRQALEAARREAMLCAQERSALRSNVADLEEILANLRRGSAELEAQFQEQQKKLEEVTATQNELVHELEAEIADGQVQIQRLRNELRVEMVDEILFDSGQATLKPEGKEVLRRVAPVLTRSERHIEVQGHTDNVPIRGRLAETYATNWELSAARAVNVARFLQEEAGMDAMKLSATGFSEYRPRASNETEGGRQRNRRIEILLAPPYELKVGEGQESSESQDSRESANPP